MAIEIPRRTPNDAAGEKGLTDDENDDDDDDGDKSGPRMTSGNGALSLLTIYVSGPFA